MHRVTRKSIKDSDIDLARVEKRLSEIAEEIKINNKNNLTDINVICEEIFGQILNKLYDIKLVSMSAEVSGNYIAVDLVDYEKRIAYQVTSQNIRNKIDRTLEKFNSSGMYKDMAAVLYEWSEGEEEEETSNEVNTDLFQPVYTINSYKKKVAAVEEFVSGATDAELEKLCTDSVELINYARNIVVKHVNIVQIMTYYSLGR